MNLNHCQHLLDGALTLYPQALADESETLYQQLRNDLDWQPGTVTVYGKQHIIPRLHAWYGDPGTDYTYSGTLLKPRPLPKVIDALRQTLNQHFQCHVNSALGNLYRSGQDHMGWHSDDEPELNAQAPIFSISLGAVRDFAVRVRGASKQHAAYGLPSGSLLIMQPGFQQHWQHSLPKRMKVATPRINLTFREIHTMP